jgi:hypothetical protein
MNKNGGNYGSMGNGGGEFELPQEVLAVLPSDPYEQLDVARRITAMAVAARVSKVEAENTLQETSARLSHALDEQVCNVCWDLEFASVSDQLGRELSQFGSLRVQHSGHV